MMTEKVTAADDTKDVKGAKTPAVSCVNCALNLLVRREHSRRELERKLLVRDFTRDEIAAALDDLQLRGLQSEERFAASYTRVRIGRGYGKQRLRSELRERGIEEELIDAALNAYDEGEWCALATRVRHKKFGAQKPKKYSTEQQKQMQFLYYRGFTSEQVNGAFEE